ncbi:GlxA family transcriptional regulator [Corynebacterium sp. A21]|uniref:GlxA family transcriptional regulator n=1 Tax=Corynebacterium sp. A21 TaxID=3457318 RepID=UPI003FD1CAC6
MKIAVHAFEGVPMFHLSVPLQVFSEAENLGLGESWRINIWSPDGAPVRTAEGVLLDDLNGPEILGEADVIIFPSWPAEFPEVAAELVELIRAGHHRGAMIVGLCLGAFPVAASGIIDGRAAVTHWGAIERFQRAYPQVKVESNAIYIDHGDVMTSAGTASGLDACLHLVRERLGARAATTLARQLVIAPHREGNQAQYIERPLPDESIPGPVSEVIDWMLANLDQPLTVTEMAERAHLSPRHFSRVFAEVSGTTPAKWLLQNRLNQSRQLLESTDLSITDIAREGGFSSAVTFRQNFRAAFSTTPTSYRSRFQETEPDLRGRR